MALWTPSDLATAPRLWLDAREPLTLSGTDVVRWPDQAGARDAVQGDAALAPRFGERQIGGLDVVTFQGNALMDLPSLGVTGAAPRAAFAVVELIGGAVGREVIINIGGYGTGVPYSRWTFKYHSTGDLRIELGGAGWTGPGLTGSAVVGCVLDGDTVADHVIYVNGVAYHATGSDPVETVDQDNGIGAVGTASATRSCGELIFTAYAPSADETDQITGYLAHGWGLAGELPAGHPYKAEAPTVADPTPVPGIRAFEGPVGRQTRHTAQGFATPAQATGRAAAWRATGHG
ncbi:hypothetical protein ACN2XU_03020 [Primorskyibacter sp. 2E107]|uniref:hypothetical protein n=1 Tax=Primorskyibacter sp. 2E107 TaxID=3403458 RepID=UPI003AF933A6